MKNYAECIKKYLSVYKTEQFPTLQGGSWRGKGGYKHILPGICGELNLLENYRDVFLNNDLSNIKYHQYFHHLNSSQAMCINFFFPLIITEKLDILLGELGLTEDILYDTAKFEKESNIDDKNAIKEKIPELQQKDTIPTSFDFYFETTKKKLYFEIKYTEKEFGSAKKDLDKYKLKYEKIYQEAANGKIQSNTEKIFLDNYQIMRNLIHVDNDSYIIFVVPEDNKSVYDQATEAKNSVMDKYQDKVKTITWDRLYEIIEEHEHGFCKTLKKHFEEFKKKYRIKK